jgi:hypothetical protein
MDSAKFGHIGGSNQVHRLSLDLESSSQKSANNIRIALRPSIDSVVRQQPAERWLPNYVPGKKPLIALPGTKKWHETKNQLKQVHVQASWRLFFEGSTRKNASEELNVRLKEVANSKAMGFLLRKVVDRFIDKKANAPHFVHFADFNSTLFVSKGTDLSSEVARTAKGNIYTIPHEIDDTLRASIRNQQGRPYAGNGNLGFGKQGEIRVAIQLNGDADVAVAAKWLKTESGLKTEPRIMSLLPRSKHFTEVRDVALVPPQKGAAPEPHVFMDLAIRGDMCDILLKLGQDTTLEMAQRDKLQRTIARQFVECVKELHDQGIYHQDIKPGNFLLSKDGAIMLADFGFASKSDAVIRAGTESYQAPEYMGTNSLKSEGDRYSLGMTLLDLRQTFPGSPALQDELAVVAMGLGAKNPANRPPLDQVLGSKYMQGEVYTDAELLALVDSL